MQMSVTCDPATFAEQVLAVDDACCDADSGANKCAGGTPSSCDGKCAVLFNGFYDRCERFLAGQMSLAEMASYNQLYATCEALPTEPLLRAAISCDAEPSEVRALSGRLSVPWRSSAFSYENQFCMGAQGA